MERAGDMKMRLAQRLATRSMPSREALRGMTLIEIIAVIAIMAIVAAGAAVVVVPMIEKARIGTAKTSAKTIRNAATMWMIHGGGEGCPTAEQLVKDKSLDVGGQKDPWGENFEIVCQGSEAIVWSRGPDKKQGGEDDIVVPEGSSISGP